MHKGFPKSSLLVTLTSGSCNNEKKSGHAFRYKTRNRRVQIKNASLTLISSSQIPKTCPSLHKTPNFLNVSLISERYQCYPVEPSINQVQNIDKKWSQRDSPPKKKLTHLHMFAILIRDGCVTGKF